MRGPKENWSDKVRKEQKVQELENFNLTVVPKKEQRETRVVSEEPESREENGNYVRYTTVKSLSIEIKF